MNCFGCFRPKRDHDAADSQEVEPKQTASTEWSSPVGAGVVTNSYGKYGLNSPPQGENPQKVEDAERNMRRDGYGSWLDNKTKSDSRQTRALVYLYGRGYHINDRRKRRCRKINEIIDQKKPLKRMTRLIQVEGDKDVTSELLYRNLCHILEAYFQKEGTVGILPDRNKNLTYFFRKQQQGNCFLVGPCVLMAYFRQFKGFKDDAAVPIDLTKFIRRTFTDQQLHTYVVEDSGGDACYALKTMLKPLMKASGDDGDDVSDDLLTVNNQKLKNGFVLEDRIRLSGPGLVTNFIVHDKHFCKKEQYKDKLGYYQFSGKQSSNGIFIEVPVVSTVEQDDQVETTVEYSLENYWRHSFCTRPHVAQEPESRTLFLDEEEKKEAEIQIGGEEDHYCDDFTKEQIRRNDGGGVVDSRDGKKKQKNEERHAMVVIGCRRDKSNGLWLLLQNWWANMELVEVSAEYLRKCGATLHFIDEDHEFDDEKFANPNPEDWFDLNQSLVADSNNLDRPNQRDGCLCFESPILDRGHATCS